MVLAGGQEERARVPLATEAEPPFVHAAIARLMRDFTIEATPREVEKLGDLTNRLRPGAKIYLTRLPKATFADTLGAAKRLCAQGFSPVPHLTARTTLDEKELYEQVRALSSEAGVDELLLVAGSQSRAAGDFESTMQLLETGVFERVGIRRIGVAGHPEGLPNVDEAHLAAALAQKNAFGRASGIDLYIMTQFFFDAAPVIRWEARIRELGNLLPVHVGFHGVTGTASLIKHAIACGIGTSLKVLTQHTSMLQLAVVRSPERLIVEVARATAQDGASCFASAHFFPLGGLAQTAAWARALADGRFAIGPNDSIRLET